jgi:hypothetical protein
MDPLSIARYGMMTAESRLTASAGRVAAGDADLGGEAVEQTLASEQFAASAKVVEFSDEMWRSLMDMQSKR